MTTRPSFDVPTTEQKPWTLGIGPACLLVVLSIGAFGLAFATRGGGGAILVALPALFLLTWLRTARRVFWLGLIAGVAIYGTQLHFFLSIFKSAAIALWLILALPLALCLLLVFWCRARLGALWATLFTPVLWTGIEFFRSELYTLRFSWLSPGQAVAFGPGVRLLGIGVYGLSFGMTLAAALLLGPTRVWRTAGVALTLVLAIAMYWPAGHAVPLSDSLHVAGVQLEHAGESQVVAALERLALSHPEAQILVLSEYTFNGPVPANVRDVIRRHGRYLIAGGVEWQNAEAFADTAFVIGPDGADVFSQGKSVPIQFMSDGVPAQKRQVWQSPWGKIGIAVCYDISYAQVMDDFVAAGAQGLIVPTMDLESWGGYERAMLHGRLGPVRAAEYGIPVFGVWSSGESQLIDATGRLIASAGYPGQGEMIAGPFELTSAGRVPIDRWPAMIASWAVAGVALVLAVASVRERIRKSRGRR